MRGHGGGAVKIATSSSQRRAGEVPVRAHGVAARESRHWPRAPWGWARGQESQSGHADASRDAATPSGADDSLVVVAGDRPYDGVAAIAAGTSARQTARPSRPSWLPTCALRMTGCGMRRRRVLAKPIATLPTPRVLEPASPAGRHCSPGTTTRLIGRTRYRSRAGGGRLVPLCVREIWRRTLRSSAPPAATITRACSKSRCGLASARPGLRRLSVGSASLAQETVSLRRAE